MQRRDELWRLFLVAALAYVAGCWLDRTLIPLSGPIAVFALAGLAWARPLPRGAAGWTRAPLVVGLACLAVVLARPDHPRLLADGLTAAACAGIGAGVLGRAGRLALVGLLPVLVLAFPLVQWVRAEVWLETQPPYESFYVATPAMEDQALSGDLVSGGSSAGPDVTFEALPEHAAFPEAPEPTPAPLPAPGIPTYPWSGFGSGILLIGLAGIVTSLFPDRE